METNSKRKSVLIRCEDTYGAYDIMCSAFENMERMENKQKKDTYILEDTVLTIERGTGTGNLFKINEDTQSVDQIIFVFDMDTWKTSNSQKKLNVLSIKDLKQKVEEFSDQCTAELLFAPIIFSAETLLLHKIDHSGTDFSGLFNMQNTAHMHTYRLYAYLSEGKEENQDKSIEEIYSENKRAFFNNDQGTPYKELGRKLRDLNQGEFNYPFLDWIATGDILNTKSLLRKEEMYKRHGDFLTFFYNKIKTMTDFQSVLAEDEEGCFFLTFDYKSDNIKEESYDD